MMWLLTKIRAKVNEFVYAILGSVIWYRGLLRYKVSMLFYNDLMRGEGANVGSKTLMWSTRRWASGLVGWNRD